MKKIFIKLIVLYQATPFHCHSMCKFQPTCSQYMKQAIESYGILKGLLLGIKRIFRCHPFGNCGYDPVPQKIKK